MIDLESLLVFTKSYPEDIAKLGHDLHKAPLLALPRLTILAGSLPRDQILNQPAHHIGSHTAENSAHQAMPAPLLLQGIGGNNQRVWLHNIAQDAEYSTLISDLLRPLLPLTRVSGAPVNDPVTDIILEPPLAERATFQEDKYCLVLQLRGRCTVTIDEDAVFTISEGDALFLPAATKCQWAVMDAVSISMHLAWPASSANSARSISWFGNIKRLWQR